MNAHNIKNGYLFNNDQVNFLHHISYYKSRVGWLVKDYKELFELIGRKQVLILTEKAGQGKTNLLCDFIDNFVLKVSPFSLFLTGNQLVSSKEIEEIVAEELNPFGTPMTLPELLRDISKICQNEGVVFTIIFDGINEASNIETFSQSLYNFTEKMIAYPYIRLVYTCRSEYFSDRFYQFENTPSFSDVLFIKKNYMQQYHRNINDDLPDYFLEKLIPAYFNYFEIKNDVSLSVKKELVKDFLLLRIFSETYGNKENQNSTEYPPIYNLYKDDLFKKYFDHKLSILGATSFINKRKYIELLNSVLEYMCYSMNFINIPIEQLSNIDLQFLMTLVNEDILFRTDLISDGTTILNNNEVLNFTFDEFRDYLIVDYILKDKHIDIFNFLKELGINQYDPNEIHFGTKFSKGRYPVIEGVLRFLFFKSRRAEYRERLRFLHDLDIYDDLFAQNIFSVNEEYINDVDIRYVKNLIRGNKTQKILLFHGLLQRGNQKIYYKLNIQILTKIIFDLSEDEYNKIINNYFRVTIDFTYSHERQKKGPIISITSKISSLLSEKTFNPESIHNYIACLLALSAVDGDGYTGPYYKLFKTIQNYLDEFPVFGTKLLFSVYNLNNKKLENIIWSFIGYMQMNELFAADFIPADDIVDFFFSRTIFQSKNNINKLIYYVSEHDLALNKEKLNNAIEQINASIKTNNLFVDDILSSFTDLLVDEDVD